MFVITFQTLSFTETRSKARHKKPQAVCFTFKTPPPVRVTSGRANLAARADGGQLQCDGFAGLLQHGRQRLQRQHNLLLHLRGHTPRSRPRQGPCLPSRGEERPAGTVSGANNVIVIAMRPDLLRRAHLRRTRVRR